MIAPASGAAVIPVTAEVPPCHTSSAGTGLRTVDRPRGEALESWVRTVDEKPTSPRLGQAATFDFESTWRDTRARGTAQHVDAVKNGGVLWVAGEASGEDGDANAIEWAALGIYYRPD